MNSMNNSEPLISFLPFLILIALGLMTTAFWIWMLVDCVTNKKLSDNERIIWVIVIVFTHWIGALIYLFVGRNKRPTGFS
jgi:hypothetical protein